MDNNNNGPQTKTHSCLHECVLAVSSYEKVGEISVKQCKVEFFTIVLG